MRHPYSRITPGDVRHTARTALADAIRWKAYGCLVTPTKLLDILLLAAALTSSLSAIVRRFRCGCSHETARQAVAANLPDVPTLTQGLLDALYAIGSRNRRRRSWVIAIDEHRDPFYGDRSTPGVTGGQKKHGTQYAYSYATATLIHHRHRYTVGLLALDGQRPHEVVTALLNPIAARGVTVRGVALDSGFDSGETVNLLQNRGLSYVVPLRRKGSPQTAGTTTNRRNAAWDLASGTVTTLTWETARGGDAVRTQALVHHRRGEPKKKVYAFGGWDASSARSMVQRARLARRWYRKRFGIETSYRQMREGKAKTTATSVAYRLLLVGLGLVLRQVWVWLTAQVARERRLKPTAWVGELPLAKMVDWLADVLRRKFQEDQAIRLGDPRPAGNTVKS